MVIADCGFRIADFRRQRASAVVTPRRNYGGQVGHGVRSQNPEEKQL
jgi:hypothetical protein